MPRFGSPRPLLPGSHRRSLLALLLGCTGALACSGRTSSNSPNAADTAGDVATVGSLALCCSDSAMGVALRIANDYRETAFTSDHIDRQTFWDQVLPMARYAEMDVATVGTLEDGGALRTLVWGSGADTLLLWSEGGDAAPGDDEAERSVGSLALADLIRWLANTRDEDRDDALRARLRAGLTLVMLPAVRANPEDTVQQRILRSVVTAWQPTVVLALRDDDAGRTETLARGSAAPAMTVRVPRSSTPEVTARATRVAAALIMALRSELPTRLYRADASVAVPRLADGAATAPLATVELESGALPADPAQRRLRAVQMAALLTTLDGIATGAVNGADTTLFARQPLRPDQAGSSPE